MKKTISMIITLAMLLTMLPLAAFAQGPTVYCQAPESWTQCYVYTWNGYGEYASWPGEPATMDANGLWVYNMPEGYEVVVFNDGHAAHSNDLYLADANGDYRYIFPQDNWAGSATPTAEYTVVGNADFMGAWDVSSTLGDMEKGPDDTYIARFFNVQPGDYEFKVVREHRWDYAWGDGEGNNYVFTVYEPTDVYIYFDSDIGNIRVDIRGDQQEYPDVVRTVFGNADFMGAWEPASTLGDMEQTGELFFEKTFLDVQPGEYEFVIIADHDPGQFWSPNGENFGFTVTEACDVRVTFEEWTGDIRVYLDGVEYIPFSSKTVHIYVPDSWETARAYTWDPEEFGAWPGMELEKDGQWYTFTSDNAELTNLVVNGNYGHQTSDLELPNWKEIWILVDQNDRIDMYSFQPNIPEEPIEYSVYSVIGSADFMGAWDVSSTLGDMDEIDDGVFYALFLDVQPGDYEFKVVGDHSWDHAWGDNGNNYRFSVDRESAVRVYFYEGDQSIRVDLEYNENLYTVVGNADFMGSWDVNSTLGDMEETGDRFYEKTFYDVQPGDYELKVVANHSWGDAWGAGAEIFFFSVTETCDIRVTFERFWDVVRVYLDGQEYIPFNEKTVHLYVPESWSAVYAYSWEPETMGPWPGIQLAKDGDWYTFTVSTEETLLHFHDNVEDGQRETLEMPHWPEIWITVERFDTTFSMYPLEVPDEPPVSPYTYTVVGNADFMGNWNPTSTFGDMEETYYNWYELYIPVVQPGDYEFKVVRDHSWDYAWGAEDGISNYAFTVEQPAEVIIIFNSEDGWIGVDISYIEEPEYKVVGDADFMGAWDVSSDLGLMTETGDGIWEVTFLNVEPGEYSFKVVQGDSWDYSWGLEANGEPVSFSTDELTNIRVIFGYKDDELGILRVDYLYNRLGDFNGDGLTDNIGGVARLFAHVRGKTLLADDLLPKADTNQDGKINIADVARMFKAVRTGENLPTIPTTE